MESRLCLVRLQGTGPPSLRQVQGRGAEDWAEGQRQGSRKGSFPKVVWAEAAAPPLIQAVRDPALGSSWTLPFTSMGLGRGPGWALPEAGPGDPGAPSESRSPGCVPVTGWVCAGTQQSPCLCPRSSVPRIRPIAGKPRARPRPAGKVGVGASRDGHPCLVLRGAAAFLSVRGMERFGKEKMHSGSGVGRHRQGWRPRTGNRPGGVLGKGWAEPWGGAGGGRSPVWSLGLVSSVSPWAEGS